MACHINFVCDFEGCNQCQSANFDNLNETWQNMIDALEGAGWQLEMNNDNPAVIVKAICPAHI